MFCRTSISEISRQKPTLLIIILLLPIFLWFDTLFAALGSLNICLGQNSTLNLGQNLNVLDNNFQFYFKTYWLGSVFLNF